PSSTRPRTSSTPSAPKSWPRCARPMSAVASGAASAGADADMSAVTLPSPDEEIWRYSRIAELDLAAYAHRPASATVMGWTAADGGRPSEPPVDVFAELNAAHADAVVLRIPAGSAVTDPIEVVWA